MIPNFVTYPGTKLSWACDVDGKRLENVLSPYPGVRRSTNFGKILDDDDVRAVVIATPVHTHFAIAKACLESGKHVLIEKPLASSVAQREELSEIAEKKNRRFMCDHTFCYTGAVRRRN